MIIDYKYHIASLVAVFLALGIGILIGSTMLGNDALIEYQKQVTDRLEEQLQSLRESNEAIQARAAALEMDSNIHKQFEQEVLPALVSGRLDGKKFGIIELNGYGFPPEITKIIENAGGQVASVTSVNNSINDEHILSQTISSLGWQESDPEQFTHRLAVEISAAIIFGTNTETVNYLKENEIVRTSGEYGIPLDSVIIIGGGYGASKRDVVFDLHVIDFFLDLQIPVIGVEETDVTFSFMKDYQRKHISTIDNIDSAPGQLAMVLALGGQPGNYGVKSTAQKLLPEIKPVSQREGAR